MLVSHESLTDLAWHEILHRHFRPSQSRKWITALWMINSWQTWGGCVRKAWKTPSSQSILLYFEFRSRPSLITGICMDPHSPNKSIATKYCFLILGDDTSLFFLIISLFFFSFLFLLFYVILLLLVFTKIILLLLFYFIFFHENYFYFFMFRDIPGSWVPVCSVFRILSTPFAAVRSTIFVRILIFHDIAWEDLQGLRGTSEIYFVATV